MKKLLLFSLALFFAATPLLLSQTSVSSPPTIPEEARRHFVIGGTIFKDAKNANAFSLAAAEFAEASQLAPQWPEARYNLALAKEAAGDYSGAMADLKLYQQFKLSETEARAVQDKIYAIEAKQKMEVSDAAAKVQAQADSKRDAFVSSILGDWKGADMSAKISINRADDGNVVVKSTGFGGGDQLVSNISINGSTLHFTYFEGDGSGDHDHVIEASVFLGSNGELVDTEIIHWAQSTIDHYTGEGKPISREGWTHSNKLVRQ
jgi:tetratricopeptide (TPR) repeat protein